MNMTFNLATDPWIPVTNIDQTTKLSLIEFFRQGDKYVQFDLKPLERIAIIRLLVSIAQYSIDGPEDEEDFKKLVANPSDAIQKIVQYLESNKSKFDFYPTDSKAGFLQIPLSKNLSKIKLENLFYEVSTGNNCIAFDHSSKVSRDYTDSEIAVGFITTLVFKADKNLGGNGVGRSPLYDDRLMVSFSNGNILSTVFYNVRPKEWISEFINQSQDKFGKPTWDCDITSEDDEHAFRHSYLGRLIPISALAAVGSGHIYCGGKGWDYGKSTAFGHHILNYRADNNVILFHEPFFDINKNQNGLYLISDVDNAQSLILEIFKLLDNNYNYRILNNIGNPYTVNFTYLGMNDKKNTVNNVFSFDFKIIPNDSDINAFKGNVAKIIEAKQKIIYVMKQQFKQQFKGDKNKIDKFEQEASNAFFNSLFIHKNNFWKASFPYDGEAIKKAIDSIFRNFIVAITIPRFIKNPLLAGSLRGQFHATYRKVLYG